MNSPKSPSSTFNNKLKLVSLQIVVNILEYVSYEYNNKSSEVY